MGGGVKGVFPSREISISLAAHIGFCYVAEGGSKLIERCREKYGVIEKARIFHIP